jgi:hypothetical protein
MIQATRCRIRHLVLLAILGHAAEPVHAEWLEVMTNIEKGQTIYVDIDSIHRNGDLVEMWTLYDYKTLQHAGQDEYRSRKVQNEFNCAQEVRRMLSVTEFSGNMGNGKVVYEKPSLLSTEPRWTRVPPGVGETLLKVACVDKKGS